MSGTNKQKNLLKKAVFRYVSLSAILGACDNMGGEIALLGCDI